MITAIVNFRLPEGATLEDATARFQSTAPLYLGHKGLTRKYYLFDPQTNTGGGCYLFETREDAEAMFDDVWRARIREKYGSEPEIRFFESPVIVDNQRGEIEGGS
ncbi:MAG: YdhR family protein [Methyloligellaceae bacterium]